MIRRTEAIALLAIGAACLALSAIGVEDRTTWLLEVFPLFIAVPLLLATARRFPLTPLVYRLIFVAVLGASSYTYAEASLSQKLPHWIASHVRAFEFFGGVPQLIIPDNLKSGVVRADRCERFAPTASFLRPYVQPQRWTTRTVAA